MIYIFKQVNIKNVSLQTAELAVSWRLDIMANNPDLDGRIEKNREACAEGFPTSFSPLWNSKVVEELKKVLGPCESPEDKKKVNNYTLDGQGKSEQERRTMLLTYLYGKGLLIPTGHECAEAFQCANEHYCLVNILGNGFYGIGILQCSWNVRDYGKKSHLAGKSCHMRGICCLCYLSDILYLLSAETQKAETYMEGCAKGIHVPCCLQCSRLERCFEKWRKLHVDILLIIFRSNQQGPAENLIKALKEGSSIVVLAYIIHKATKNMPNSIQEIRSVRKLLDIAESYVGSLDDYESRMQSLFDIPDGEKIEDWRLFFCYSEHLYYIINVDKLPNDTAGMNHGNCLHLSVLQGIQLCSVYRATAEGGDDPMLEQLEQYAHKKNLGMLGTIYFHYLYKNSQDPPLPILSNIQDHAGSQEYQEWIQNVYKRKQVKHSQHFLANQAKKELQSLKDRGASQELIADVEKKIDTMRKNKQLTDYARDSAREFEGSAKRARKARDTFDQVARTFGNKPKSMLHQVHRYFQNNPHPEADTSDNFLNTSTKTLAEGMQRVFNGENVAYSIAENIGYALHWISGKIIDPFIQDAPDSEDDDDF